MRFCYYFYGLRYREGRFRTSFVDAGFPIATSLVRGPWTSIPEITLDARSDVWTPSNFATADFSAYILMRPRSDQRHAHEFNFEHREGDEIVTLRRGREEKKKEEEKVDVS